MIQLKDWEVVLRNPAFFFYLSIISAILILSIIIGYSFNPILCSLGLLMIGIYLIFYYTVYRNIKRKKSKN
jgi:hypothetical protein